MTLKRPPTAGTRRGNGAGKGDGWGGAAKGAGQRGPGPGRPPAEIEAALRARREAEAQALLDHIRDLATTAERQETQLSAAVAFTNRVLGTPVARNELTGKDGAALPTGINVTFVQPGGG